MKKLLAFALVLVLSLGLCVTASAEANDTWVMAINATFPPFESIADGTTEYVGIDIDIAEVKVSRVIIKRAVFPCCIIAV